MSDVEEKSGAERGGLVRRRRRRWSEAQKRQIVAETHEPGVSVPMVAQRYNVNANQVFAGGGGCFARRRAIPGSTGSCLWSSEQCRVTRWVAATMHPPSDDPVAAGPPAPGRMEIVLAGGRRVIVDRAVDGSALARVLAVLERR